MGTTEQGLAVRTILVAVLAVATTPATRSYGPAARSTAVHTSARSTSPGAASSSSSTARVTATSVADLFSGRACRQPGYGPCPAGPG